MPDPDPNSGLTVRDMKRAVARTIRSARKYPVLRFMLENVPARYMPTDDEIDELLKDDATDDASGQRRSV